MTIEFKQFGVSLAFVPTVASDGQITLKVRPEVSQLSNQNAVQLTAGNSTIVVPSLTVRRAETTVQLGSGESFAIAGLLQDSSQRWPAAACRSWATCRSSARCSVPIKFQRNETELVIVVTPYVVRPVASPTTLRLPTDGYQPPSDLERILLLRQSARHNQRRRTGRTRRHRISPATPASSCNDGDALMLRRQLLCIARRGAGGLRCHRSVSPGRRVAAERRQRSQSASDGGLALRPGARRFQSGRRRTAGRGRAGPA